MTPTRLNKKVTNFELIKLLMVHYDIGVGDAIYALEDESDDEIVIDEDTCEHPKEYEEYEETIDEDGLGGAGYVAGAVCKLCGLWRSAYEMDW